MHPRSRVRMPVTLLTILFGICVTSEPVRGQCELDTVNASDATAYDHFGQSVAMDADFVVIGAPGAERVGREFIPSYVFRRVGSAWVEDAILAPDDISPRSQFGRSVAISDEVIVVGAIIDGHSEPFQYDGPGSAYVYRLGETGWAEEAKLVASDAAMGNFFGGSVAVDGCCILVGASGYGRDTDNTGAAYVFDHDGAQWTEHARLTASDANEYDMFGSAVAVEGSVAVVGALNVGHTDRWSTDGTGAVYVFRFDGHVWSEEAKLTVEGLPPGAWLGGAVSISGDTIVAGALGDNAMGDDSGAVYVFRHGPEGWAFEERLIGNDTDWSDRFGGSVAIRGQLALVGAYNTQNGRGSAYVFQRSDTNWSQVAKLTASDEPVSQSWFGFAVAHDEEFVAVGASIADRVGTNAGSAYFYRIIGGADCNGNNINDACEPDCNQNSVPDACDIANGTSNDCNSNAIPDDCEIDCNQNSVPDDCDITNGTSNDCNANVIPDECEIDCNANEIPDDCDIADGSSEDCNHNGVPDDCEPDCNENGIADSCDIEGGTSADCNVNGVPDECEPDEDCNGNGVQDICDIASGTSEDCNGSDVPDECEMADGRFFFTDVPGLLGRYGGWN